MTPAVPRPRPAYTDAAVRALTEAAESEPDFSGWLSDVLARTAALRGSVASLIAGRPGSWEAPHVEALAYGVLLGDRELLEWYARDERQRQAAGSGGE